ncbi:MAG: bifunctional UDP-N-acetylmuramoyl-tripeptide:D-alanyl-D-alanine ligase/alanine racemase [Bacteroidetes bacterium]|nr:bifunctional UDP-N-acetylmuramoyl-tripeptide:D-alanyl-D-alanine ligase/alanine racemase [Bacteroidota bacterium]
MAKTAPKPPFQLNSSELPAITGGSWIQYHGEKPVTTLLTDSRKSFPEEGVVFIAFEGAGRDGHQFIQSLYERGVRQFVVSREINKEDLPLANIFYCVSPIDFLQKVASHHRKHFNIPVIGITGSNGKTIIKEWLFQVLEPEHSVVKSPASYNSQIGVPLSVWQMQPENTLGIFEAGVSKTGEMENLRKVIQPTIGLFTNLLSAHDEGFSSKKEKALEKAQLFKSVDRLICCSDDQLITEAIKGLPTFTWGSLGSPDLRIGFEQGQLSVKNQKVDFNITLASVDSASVQNLSHVVATMVVLGYEPEVIIKRVSQLRPLPMRLEMKEAINGCKLIDDSYSNDLSSLRIALDFLSAQHSGEKIIILSDLQQTGLDKKVWIDEAAKMIQKAGVSGFIGIGPELENAARRMHPKGIGFPDTESFLRKADLQQWINTGILVKGARSFRLEQVVERLARKIHGTVMEVDLLALNRNLGYYRSLLPKGTRMMVMVKAFAYGSGAAEIARFLEHSGVDYLGVAYADEGASLRNHGIGVPVMVMNPSPESIGLLLTYGLEPAVYSMKSLQVLIEKVRGESLNIHLKLDTGMHRLGFESGEIEDLLLLLKENPHLRVVSVYSHLAASEDAGHDEFTRLQFDRFDKMYERVSAVLGYLPLRHILNTAGIERHPSHAMEMVRLGIGLYGASGNPNLENVLTLKSVISQVKTLAPDETVGYGRHGRVAAGSVIGTVALGYADGYHRAFGKGVGKMLVRGTLVPTVGNICMDMTMIDLTGTDAEEGDEVIVFGKDIPPSRVASWIGTIPYEILTATGERVRRIFHSSG